jgi:hypothetical protein
VRRLILTAVAQYRYSICGNREFAAQRPQPYFYLTESWTYVTQAHLPNFALKPVNIANRNAALPFCDVPQGADRRVCQCIAR